MASLPTGLKAVSATAADAPRPAGAENERLEALRQVYASISSRDELEALLNDVQQCAITGNSSAIFSSVTWRLGFCTQTSILLPR